MPSDVSKCPGENCPVKETCYRYTMPVHEKSEGWQVWTDFVYDHDKQECYGYWENI